jgi:hypothetical protein
MAISYSYPIAEPASSSMLLGTMIDEETGRIATKSYLMGDIFDLFELSLPFKSLTTNGTTGAATLTDGVLNIPNYGAAPYKSYYVLLTQSSGDPAKTILYDTLGLWQIEYARVSPGVYTATISGHLATFNNAWYSLTDNRFALVDGNYMVINKTSSTVLTIYTFKNNAPTDGLLSNTPLEIKIF